MSRKIILAGLFAVAATAAAGSAQAQMLSPFQAGYNLALSRGYGPAQSHCFASVFARRATISPRGQWVAEANNSYVDELWSRCRVSR